MIIISSSTLGTVSTPCRDDDEDVKRVDGCDVASVGGRLGVTRRDDAASGP